MAEDQKIEPNIKYNDKVFRTFYYNVIGVMLPFLLSTIPILLLKKVDRLWSFLDEGDFFLFSAGLLTSSILLYNENRDDVKEVLDKRISFWALWVLIFCSCFYAILYCLTLIDISVNQSICFIRLCSITVFVFALWSIRRSVKIDSWKSVNIDVTKKSNDDVNDLIKGL